MEILLVFTLEYIENAIQKIGRVMMYYDIELNEIELSRITVW